MSILTSFRLFQSYLSKDYASWPPSLEKEQFIRTVIKVAAKWNAIEVGRGPEFEGELEKVLLLKELTELERFLEDFRRRVPENLQKEYFMQIQGELQGSARDSDRQGRVLSSSSSQPYFTAPRAHSGQLNLSSSVVANDNDSSDSPAESNLALSTQQSPSSFSAPPVLSALVPARLPPPPLNQQNPSSSQNIQALSALGISHSSVPDLATAPAIHSGQFGPLISHSPVQLNWVAPNASSDNSSSQLAPDPADQDLIAPLTDASFEGEWRRQYPSSSLPPSWPPPGATSGQAHPSSSSSSQPHFAAPRAHSGQLNPIALNPRDKWWRTFEGLRSDLCLSISPEDREIAEIICSLEITEWENARTTVKNTNFHNLLKRASLASFDVKQQRYLVCSVFLNFWDSVKRNELLRDFLDKLCSTAEEKLDLLGALLNDLPPKRQDRCKAELKIHRFLLVKEHNLPFERVQLGVRERNRLGALGVFSKDSEEDVSPLESAPQSPIFTYEEILEKATKFSKKTKIDEVKAVYSWLEKTDVHSLGTARIGSLACSVYSSHLSCIERVHFLRLLLDKLHSNRDKKLEFCSSLLKSEMKAKRKTELKVCFCLLAKTYGLDRLDVSAEDSDFVESGAQSNGVVPDVPSNNSSPQILLNQDPQDLIAPLTNAPLPVASDRQHSLAQEFDIDDLLPPPPAHPPLSQHFRKKRPYEQPTEQSSSNRRAIGGDAIHSGQANIDADPQSVLMSPTSEVHGDPIHPLSLLSPIETDTEMTAQHLGLGTAPFSPNFQSPSNRPDERMLSLLSPIGGVEAEDAEPEAPVRGTSASDEADTLIREFFKKSHSRLENELFIYGLMGKYGADEEGKLKILETAFESYKGRPTRKSELREECCAVVKEYGLSSKNPKIINILGTTREGSKWRKEARQRILPTMNPDQKIETLETYFRSFQSSERNKTYLQDCIAVTFYEGLDPRKLKCFPRVQKSLQKMFLKDDLEKVTVNLEAIVTDLGACRKDEGPWKTLQNLGVVSSVHEIEALIQSFHTTNPTSLGREIFLSGLLNKCGLNEDLKAEILRKAYKTLVPGMTSTAKQELKQDCLMVGIKHGVDLTNSRIAESRSGIPKEGLTRLERHPSLWRIPDKGLARLERRASFETAIRAAGTDQRAQLEALNGALQAALGESRKRTKSTRAKKQTQDRQHAVIVALAAGLDPRELQISDRFKKTLTLWLGEGPRGVLLFKTPYTETT